MEIAIVLLVLVMMLQLLDAMFVCLSSYALLSGASCFIGGVTTAPKMTSELVKNTDLELEFKVTDVTKPLLAVRRITGMGNRVCFGPEKEDNFVENVASGIRVPLRQTGGSYILDGSFPGAKKPVAITVDSGAEDSVCPKDWGSQFGLNANVRKVEFRNANGGIINHLGNRKVLLTSPF